MAVALENHPAVVRVFAQRVSPYELHVVDVEEEQPEQQHGGNSDAPKRPVHRSGRWLTTCVISPVSWSAGGIGARGTGDGVRPAALMRMSSAISA